MIFVDRNAIYKQALACKQDQKEMTFSAEQIIVMVELWCESDKKVEYLENLLLRR